jgi:colicin import membrane protein
MSATLPLPSAAAERLDPFRYGWRYVRQTGPDGKPDTVMVPLTLEDALHPREEDRYMVSYAHIRDLFYLRGAFETKLVGTPGAVVLADMRVAWDADGRYAHGPDVAVVFNVREQRDWSTFNVVAEGTRPALIVEITSESTRSNDLVKKVREYAGVGVPRYVIVDADEAGPSRNISLLHYQLPPGDTNYERIPASANGRVWLPEVRLWLAAEAGRIVCIDDRGRRVEDFALNVQAREQAEREAANAKRHAADVSEALTKEVEARMADTVARLEAERRLNEEAAARKTAEHREAEKDERLKQLEAELQRLRGDAPPTA